VKLAGSQAERFLRRPDPATGVVLIYGADEGLVRERVERLIATVLDDPKDPFRLSELSVDLVRAEPARLADEARSLCLLGGRRVVRLRQASDQATAACRALLALERIEALVIIDAGELASGSSLRRLIEGARHAAAIACYRDEGRDLAAFLDRELAERHLRADADARAWLLEHVGADRGVTRAELDKLALYLGATDAAAAAPRATLDDVAAVVGDSAALGLDDLVHAVALGELGALERCLERLLGEGQEPVRLVRAQANHFARLHRLAALIERGASLEQVVERARPPIHFRRKSSVRSELRRWSAARAAHALARLLEAEIACKTTGWPARALCRHALFTACAEASGRRSPLAI
jgi:DNA polymerase III subunit delta